MSCACVCACVRVCVRPRVYMLCSSPGVCSNCFSCAFTLVFAVPNVFVHVYIGMHVYVWGALATTAADLLTLSTFLIHFLHLHLLF